MTVELPPDFEEINYTYEAHRLDLTTDPRANPVRTSTYYADGRLATDTDATLTTSPATRTTWRRGPPRRRSRMAAS